MHGSGKLMRVLQAGCRCDALVVQRLVLPTLPCHPVVFECCLQLGVEGAEVVLLAISDIYSASRRSTSTPVEACAREGIERKEV
jgi:hypothetical protein